MTTQNIVGIYFFLAVFASLAIFASKKEQVNVGFSEISEFHPRPIFSATSALSAVKFLASLSG